MSVLQDEFFAIGGRVAADEVLEHGTVGELLVIVAAPSERILGNGKAQICELHEPGSLSFSHCGGIAVIKSGAKWDVWWG